MTRAETQLSVADIFGLRPARERLAQTKVALFGDPHVPSTRWGVSSLRIMNPRLSFSTWLRRRRADGRVPIYNLFNRTPTPVEEGWSVRHTQVRDFRGGQLSYDSHNGTDFAVPVGTRVVASAGGTVIRVSNEFHRGGLKVFIDHGVGLVTSYNHLAASLVRVGDRVRRGQPIALAGASGIDNVLMFPWTAPHVHYNVFLNGVHTDPYAARGTTEASLWVGGEPVPALDGGGGSLGHPPNGYDCDHLRRLTEACRCPALRERLRRMSATAELGAELLFQTTYFPTRFGVRLPLYAETLPRRELLSLPFSSEDYVGAYLQEP